MVMEDAHTLKMGKSWANCSLSWQFTNVLVLGLDMQCISSQYTIIWLILNLCFPTSVRNSFKHLRVIMDVLHYIQWLAWKDLSKIIFIFHLNIKLNFAEHLFQETCTKYCYVFNRPIKEVTGHSQGESEWLPHISSL